MAAFFLRSLSRLRHSPCPVHKVLEQLPDELFRRVIRQVPVSVEALGGVGAVNPCTYKVTNSRRLVGMNDIVM
jgi:hypothetical protein